MKKLDKLIDKNKKAEVKIKEFSELLDRLTETDQKKKALWKEIYENAISDRERASMLFTEAFKTMTGSSSDHTAMGSILTKYLERMCKSNDQILQLADLINKAETAETHLDSEELFSKISQE
tara:strand:- start:11 stop:376 length:366 start_codon:yes stop_codon:yes gene_type:complete